MDNEFQKKPKPIQQVDMLDTYYRRGEVPRGLRVDLTDKVSSDIKNIIDTIRNGTYQHKLMLFTGNNKGKTLSAGMLLREWLLSQRYNVSHGTPGLFLSTHQLCYQNRTTDRYAKNPGLDAIIKAACDTDFLVIDGMFSYMTQVDDLLLQAIYDARQYSMRTTIVTTTVTDPLSTSTSLLFRIARDAEFKKKF